MNKDTTKFDEMDELQTMEFVKGLANGSKLDKEAREKLSNYLRNSDITSRALRLACLRICDARGITDDEAIQEFYEENLSDLLEEATLQYNEEKNK